MINGVKTMQKLTQTLALLAVAGIAGGGTSAPGLLGKLKGGAGKVVGAVEDVADNLGETIDSTVGLAASDKSPAETRFMIDAMAAASLQRLFAEQHDAKALFDTTAGYAVFDTRKIGALGVSAGLGRGVAVSQATSGRTYMNMGTGGLGLSLGIGGFETQIVILFETPEGFQSFTTDGYDASAQAGSMFGDETAGETAQFVDGRSIFVLSKKGWKISATAAGTKYWVDPKLN
jgi:hypothetical protein